MINQPPFRNKTFTILLLIIITAGVLIRIFVVFSIPTLPVEDFWSYFNRAVSLADRGVYQAISGINNASFPPGYSLLLSLFFKLPIERLTGAKMINIGLGASSIFLLALITEKLFSTKAALIASLIYCLYPRAILMCTLIASENLFNPLILLFVYLTLQTDHEITIKEALLQGLILGLATLTRSIAWLLSIVWLMYQLFRKIPIKKWAPCFVVITAAQFLILLPWGIRNYRDLGQFTVLTSTSGMNLFIGNNEQASGEWYFWTDDIRKLDPEFDNRTVAMQNQIAGEKAMEWIKSHPGEALRLYFKKLGLLFRDEHYVPIMAIYGKQLSPPWPAIDVLTDYSKFLPWQNTLFTIFDSDYWFFLILGLMGIPLSILQLKNRERFKARWLFLVGMIGYFPLTTAVYLASTRFHWIVTDLLIPFAAYLLSLLFIKQPMIDEQLPATEKG